MPHPRRGEVWMVDLGMTAKVRPCLLLTDFPADNELALVTVVGHTTTWRGNPWECAVRKPFLKPGAFHLQEVHSVPVVKLTRKLGELAQAELTAVGEGLRCRLRV